MNQNAQKTYTPNQKEQLQTQNQGGQRFQRTTTSPFQIQRPISQTQSSMVPVQSQRIQRQILDGNNIAQDLDQRLIILLQQLKLNNDVTIELAKEMLNEFKHGLLRVNEQQVNQSTINQIQQVLDKRGDQLKFITLRMYLSQILMAFDFKDKKQLGPKVLHDLTQEVSDYGEDILIFFFDESKEWFKALQAQLFESLPDTLLNHLIVDAQFPFVMDSLLATRTCTYSENIVNLIWNKLTTLKDETMIMRNIRWVVELCQKGENYYTEFMTKGIFGQIKQINKFIKLNQTEFIQIITEFLDYLIKMKYDPNILVILSRCEVFKIYKFKQQIDLPVKLYYKLYCLLDHMSINCQDDQLEGCFSHSTWYQEVLLKIIMQHKSKFIANLSILKMKKFLQSDSRKHFQFILEQITDRELYEMLQ